MAMASSYPPSRQSHGPPQYFAGDPVRWVISPILAGFKAIADGEMDEYPEQAFYMIGDIEEVKEKAKSV